jgi:hypothetical protein
MGRVLVATVVVLAVCYSPAQAATTVAKVGDLSLRAREKGGRLCITLFRNVRNYQGMACGRVPRSPHRPLVIFPDTFVDHYVAAVAPSVRIAETEDRKGRRARYRTFPGRGFGVRFVLIPAPLSPVLCDSTASAVGCWAWMQDWRATSQWRTTRRGSSASPATT